MLRPWRSCCSKSPQLALHSIELLQGLLQLALMFKNSSKLGLGELGLGDNRIGGVAGQCMLRSLQAYAATAPAGMFVDSKNCSTGTLEP